jgi:NAD(P)-dependent dehydrogenase (short-subunit alcohol dehydrogenase family)
MDLELQGRCVLVTGGSRGIGLAVARGLLREGAAVTIASHDRARSDAAVAVVAADTGGKVEGRTADLGVETERLVVIQKARALRELGDEARWRDYYADKPLRRAATPDEVANVILFLASAHKLGQRRGGAGRRRLPASGELVLTLRGGQTNSR